MALSAGLAGMMLLAGACANPSAVRRHEDGTMSVECPGGYHDWSVCHERAARACGAAGFEILSRVSNEGSGGVGTRDWTSAGSEVSRTLLIRCRDH